MCLFEEIEGATIDHYVDVYVATLLSATKNRNLVPQLISLCEATMYKFKVPGRTAAFVSAVQNSLDVSFMKQLVEYYKPNLAEQVSKYDGCDSNVREKLILMLENASEKASPKGLGGLFNNLFRKR